MVNLAEKHDEGSSAQLADAEISRILTALQKAEFKRSESGNARPDQTFKPRSLMEIAETAQQQDEAANAAEMAIANTAPEDTKNQPDQINLDDDRQGPDLATTTDTADPAVHLAAMPTDEATGNSIGNVDQAGNGAPDTSPSGAPQSHQAAPTGGGELPATDMGVGADAGHESGADHGAGHAVPTSPFETAQAAYDRGYGDGVGAGREAVEAELRTTIEAEFETKLADKISAFETALTALAKPQTVDTTNLSTSLQAAVIRLAAARAGAAIDQLPKLMVTRIENLADAAGKNISKGHVFMHPDDCAVIAPILETYEGQFKIEPDPELYRGDIRIRFDGMDISDIADLRADWQISQSMKHENVAEVETPQAQNSDAKLETWAADNLSLDPQNASTESGINPAPLQDGQNGKPILNDGEDNDDVSPPEEIGLMPLTTTGGDDSASGVGAGDKEATSSSEEIGLMPLTTTGGDDAASGLGAGDNEDASSSEEIGLMPLTSKNIDE